MKNITLKLVFAFGILALNMNTFAQTTPKIFQLTTAETRPGDAVLMRGEYIDQVKTIQIARLVDDNVSQKQPSYVPQPKEDALLDKDGTDRRAKAPNIQGFTTVKLLLQNPQSVKFIVPVNFNAGVFAVRIVANDGNEQLFYLNVPKVNWAISEAGTKGLAGDYLRLQGKNLFRKGMSGQLVCIDEKGKATRIKVDKVFDEYSLKLNLPKEMPVGNYHCYFHNGYGGSTAWSESLKLAVVNKYTENWDKKIVDVKNFGALGDGKNDETLAFRSALEAAAKNGGGTVYVPRGRYMLTDEIIMPPNTLIKGESRQLVQLFWNSLYWKIDQMPNSLISGTHHFGLKNLDIWASRAYGLIVQNGPLAEQGHVTLENIILRQSAQLSGKIYQKKPSRDSVENEINKRWTKTGIILRGENLKIRNCEFNSSGMYTFSAASGFIQNCKFERRGTGVNQPYMLIHPKGLIFEDCLKQGDGYGYAASIDESYNLYEARNVIPFNYTNDREAMTFDGGSGGYFGPIGSAANALIILPKNAQTYQWVANKWIGGGLFIIEGKGAGQYRRILSHGLDSILLDQPFLVNPDSSSVISITTIRKNMFFVNNEVTEAGAYQFYGSAQNAVISGLKMRRCNGIVGRGSLLYHGKQPNWYIDIVNCDFAEGNYSHWYGINDRGHSGNQNINLIGSGGSGLNIGTLIRRNTLRDYSYIRTSPGGNANAVTDVIIEDNSITLAKIAISLGGSGSQTSYTLIHNNHYSEVEKQVESKNLKTANLILNDGVIPAKKN
jgi:hypothetical protein